MNSIKIYCHLAILIVSGAYFPANADSVASSAFLKDRPVEEPLCREYSPAIPKSSATVANKELGVPEVVHPSIGTEVRFGRGGRLRLMDKLSNFPGKTSRPADPDIASPKSVKIHPSGKKFYVNSLEGGKTVVYSLPGLEKLAVIHHRFDGSQSHLWAPASGLFRFRHYSDNLNTFTGRPVESAFSHGGRYLWVPYYRRSFDLNAQDPSALAVIDTESDRIVRLMEAGVLPKMIALSPDGSVMAVAHWGDNTVGLIDVSSDHPDDWKYIANVAIGKQLFHNFSLRESVDRDSNTGEALRGTAFTPDSRYALIGCMGGGGGIAVIDIREKAYLGKITGILPNVRHLVVKGDWLYASINVAGYVERVSIRRIMEAIESRGHSLTMRVGGWEKVKVAPGARTISLSPRGDYIFAACNLGSRICVVDSGMRLLAEIPADSYPVGLDVSPDGRWLITTSQGRNHVGGNCVDVFSLEGVAPEEVFAADGVDVSDDSIAPDPATVAAENSAAELDRNVKHPLIIGMGISMAILFVLFIIIRRRKQ